MHSVYMKQDFSTHTVAIVILATMIFILINQ